MNEMSTKVGKQTGYLAKDKKPPKAEEALDSPTHPAPLDGDGEDTLCHSTPGDELAPSLPTVQSLPSSHSIRSSLPGAYANFPGGYIYRLMTARLTGSRDPTANIASNSHIASQDASSNLPVLASAEQDACKGLAQARLVTDEEDQLTVAIATEQKNKRQSQDTKTLFVRYKCQLLCVLVLVIVAALGLWQWRPLQKEDSIDSSDVQTKPQEINTKDEDELSPQAIIQSLLPPETLLSLQRPMSPQSKAFGWLLKDPKVLSYSQERIQQRFALATFFYSTNGPTWNASKSWLSYEQHECYWEVQPAYTGLFTTDLMTLPPCEEEFYNNIESNIGRYEQLWMVQNELAGTVPPEVSLLSSVESFSLFLNHNVSGAIPTELARMTNLVHLNLAITQLTGEIPTELGLLTHLTFLSLRGISETGKKLRGTIPTELGLLTGLLRLGISKADVSGTLPTELFQLSDLLSFDTRDTLISGMIPSEVGLWTSLTYSLMDHSRYTGTIPTEIGNLKRANWLDLSGNALSASIPTEIGLLEDVTELFLADNSLSSTIPTELNGLQVLLRCSMSNNKLTGRLPELGSLSNLILLNFGRNALSGSIPSSYGLLDALNSLDLANNVLRSSIPSELGILSSVTRLLLQDNLLNGTLPVELADLGLLQEWNSANNLLSGEIPLEFAKLASIQTFNVSGNDNLARGSGIPAGLCKGNQSLLLVFDCSKYYCGCTTDPMPELLDVDVNFIVTDMQGDWDEADPSQ